MALAVQPAVERAKDFFAGGFDSPGIGGAEVVAEESLYTGISGFASGLAATHAVGDDSGHALGAQQRTVGDTDPAGIVVAFLGPGFGVLAGDDGEFGHGGDDVTLTDLDHLHRSVRQNLSHVTLGFFEEEQHGNQYHDG